MRPATQKRLILSLESIQKALDFYKEIYRKNAYRIDLNPSKLISLQMRTLLTILIIEKIIESGKFLQEYTYKFGFKSESFRYQLANSLIPEYTLEQILLICDLVNLSLIETKKLVLKNILELMGEQREKGQYEKFNSLFTKN